VTGEGETVDLILSVVPIFFCLLPIRTPARAFGAAAVHRAPPGSRTRLRNDSQGTSSYQHVPRHFSTMSKRKHPTGSAASKDAWKQNPMQSVNNHKFLNQPGDAVCESLEGFVQSHPNCQLLDGLPDIKVVVRANTLLSNVDKNKVAVISGGGSGHEPAHAGFVGEGMLNAAVCGDVFASPSVDAVLAAIRHVCGPNGCLIIVKNYTGDRLNFGLAAERAKLEGFLVEIVVVGDDCALPPPLGVAGRRGTASWRFPNPGTLFLPPLFASLPVPFTTTAATVTNPYQDSPD
jgi:hypothetical protein